MKKVRTNKEIYMEAAKTAANISKIEDIALNAMHTLRREMDEGRYRYMKINHQQFLVYDSLLNVAVCAGHIERKMLLFAAGDPEDFEVMEVIEESCPEVSDWDYRLTEALFVDSWDMQFAHLEPSKISVANEN